VKKTKLTTFDIYKKQAFRDPSFRKALQEPSGDPFLDVAYRLIVLRRELGFTQAQLAQRIHISQQALARLESLNYKGHSLRSLDKIARACGRKLRIDFVEA
jgi:DNA-binding XRE family transcriptional regulator